MRTAVLFRTYQWDDFSRAAAGRLARQCDGCDLFVVADETASGRLDTAPWPRIAHAERDFPALGLPCLSPPRTKPLWWNCDYGLYDAVLRLPEHDVFLSVEDDVAVNTPLAPIAAAMRQRGIDAVVAQGPNPVASWAHAWSCADLPYPERRWSALGTLFLHRRAALFLLGERRRLGAMLATGAIAAWPFCEGFVASALLAGGWRCAELSGFGDTTYFGSQLIYLEADARTQRPGSFAHAVLDPARFERKFVARAYEVMLRGDKPHALLVAREGLAAAGRTEFAGWRIRPAAGNLALDRPCRQSSLHATSRKPLGARLDPLAIDARGAASGVLTGRAGFRTGVEERPWWQVDLGGVHEVREVVLFGTREPVLPARVLDLLVSLDGETWAEVFRTDAGGLVGLGGPITCRLPRPSPSRFVRIRLDGVGSLALDEVEVFAGAVGTGGASARSAAV